MDHHMKTKSCASTMDLDQEPILKNLTRCKDQEG